MFNIEFLDKKNKKNQILSGRITIGDFSESFNSSLVYWDRIEYINQWYDTINSIISGYEYTGCLITSMVKPIKANYIFCWPLYREVNKIHIQNRILFLKDISGKFDLSKLSNYVSPRMVINDEGAKISEWQATFRNLETFLKKLKKERYSILE